ncbi:MAG: methyltransferase domain-containing protein [Cytophagales bacterium]
MTSDGFVNIPFTKENMDIYIIRKSIINAINTCLPQFKGNLLDIGCGKMPYRQHILDNSAITNYNGLDIETALIYDEQVSPDYTWDGITMPFAKDKFDTAFGTEVLEHCPDPSRILKEVHRVLKPNGLFFFTVPFLWNLHEVPNDYYRYTPFSLESYLKDSGFKQIEIHAHGGWHLGMAQMLGLWMRRSSIKEIKEWKRSILSNTIIRVMRKLIKWSSSEHVSFKEGQMISGLYGTAIK